MQNFNTLEKCNVSYAKTPSHVIRSVTAQNSSKSKALPGRADW